MNQDFIERNIGDEARDSRVQKRNGVAVPCNDLPPHNARSPRTQTNCEVLDEILKNIIAQIRGNAPKRLTNQPCSEGYANPDLGFTYIETKRANARYKYKYTAYN